MSADKHLYTKKDDGKPFNHVPRQTLTDITAERREAKRLRLKKLLLEGREAIEENNNE
jgi:hypothetical protein